MRRIVFQCEVGRRAALLLLGGVALLAGGCFGRPARVSVPSISPRDAAQRALAEYDTNHDGYLDARELERCPALQHDLKQLDTNHDKKISADEIADRLAAFVDSKVGLVGVSCRVQLDGRPLERATVTLRPEAFLGDAIKPAAGTSDARGNVLLRVEGESVPGTRWGYFRIEVSKPDAGGKETLPARYNTSTTLGQGVAPDRREAIVLRLTSNS